MRLPWQRPLPGNGALNIQQLWASEGRTREPILIKFGTQLQITTSMIVTWSNIKIFKIQNGGRPPSWKCWKCYNSPTNVPIWTKLGWSYPIMSPDMSAMMRLLWQRPLPSNGALNIQQLWASGGRTREPILIKFGTQLQITTSMIVTWSNITIFKIQHGGWPPC